MSYWNKIKNLLSPTEKEQKEEIVFTPEELREMQDRDTAVGRLLNPYDVDEYSVGGPRELYYKGLGSPNKSTIEKQHDEETTNLIADAYVKDAEKKGIIHPDEDRITKNYKIIDDVKKRKNLENVPITFKDLHSNWGEYWDDSKNIYLNTKIAPFYDIDPNRERVKKNAPSLFSRLERLSEGNPFLDEELYEKMPLSEQKKIQKLINDRHLSTSIHELRHAEDYQNHPELAKKNFNGHHFKDANKYYNEDEHDAGRIHDITAAALQRLSNMGKKKNE